MRALHLELHCHTVYSTDGLIDYESLLRTAARVGLDAVAITDHDTLEGARDFQQRACAQQCSLQLIAGEERTLSDGSHFIGLFLEKPIVSNSLVEMVAEVEEQGGLCMIPHPFRRKDGLLRQGLAPLELLPRSSVGFELFSAKSSASDNQKARALLTSNMGPFGGSDAHYESDLGESMNVVPWQGDLKSTVVAMLQRRVPFQILGRAQRAVEGERQYAPLYYRYKKFVRVPRPFLPVAKQCYRWYRNWKYGVGRKALAQVYAHP